MRFNYLSPKGLSSHLKHPSHFRRVLLFQTLFHSSSSLLLLLYSNCSHYSFDGSFLGFSTEYNLFCVGFVNLAFHCLKSQTIYRHSTTENSHLYMAIVLY